MSGRPEEYPLEVESAWIPGWDFTVVFDDVLVGGLGEELDQLVENLAASEGITAILHETERCCISRWMTSTFPRSRRR